MPTTARKISNSLIKTTIIALLTLDLSLALSAVTVVTAADLLFIRGFETGMMLS
jgi:hypothetical protein